MCRLHRSPIDYLGSVWSSLDYPGSSSGGISPLCSDEAHDWINKQPTPGARGSHSGLVECLFSSRLLSAETQQFTNYDFIPRLWYFVTRGNCDHVIFTPRVENFRKDFIHSSRGREAHSSLVYTGMSLKWTKTWGYYLTCIGEECDKPERSYNVCKSLNEFCWLIKFVKSNLQKR